MPFSEALRSLRRRRGLSQEELARRAGTSKQVVSRYENGQRVPKISAAAAFAQALDVPLAALVGGDDPALIPGVERPDFYRVPLLGDIACGEPILAEENVEDYVAVDASIRCDFTLRCRGDSMQPRLLDGDIVMIRQQPDVLDGQIAAVLIGSEATLKHVYHLPQNAGLRLMPENPAYDPIFVTPENADTVRVLGRAVGYQRLLTKG